MKTWAITYLITFATLGCIDDVNGQCKHIHETKAAIFLDVTDPEHRAMLKANIKEEFKQFQIYFAQNHSISLCHRASVKIAPINDKGANRMIHVVSKPVDSDMTPTQIKRTVENIFNRDFQKGLAQTIQSVPNDTTELKQTFIYEPLCLYLNELKNNRQPIDILLYSDLQEHGQVSFYKQGKVIPVEKTLKLLESNCHCTLPSDLSFLRIHLISFRTSDNDRLIGPARKFWEEVFQQRKATVVSGTGFQGEGTKQGKR